MYLRLRLRLRTHMCGVVHVCFTVCTVMHGHTRAMTDALT